MLARRVAAWEAEPDERMTPAYNNMLAKWKAGF
jgi:hypothetical protein